MLPFPLNRHITGPAMQFSVSSIVHIILFSSPEHVINSIIRAISGLNGNSRALIPEFNEFQNKGTEKTGM
jgi:hypothetical protein